MSRWLGKWLQGLIKGTVSTSLEIGQTQQAGLLLSSSLTAPVISTRKSLRFLAPKSGGVIAFASWLGTDDSVSAIRSRGYSVYSYVESTDLPVPCLVRLEIWMDLMGSMGVPERRGPSINVF